MCLFVALLEELQSVSVHQVLLFAALCIVLRIIGLLVWLVRLEQMGDLIRNVIVLLVSVDLVHGLPNELNFRCPNCSRL